MKVLVLGATGATGKLVVQQLIKLNVEVKIVVRRVTDELQEMITNAQIESVIGSISEFECRDFVNLIHDCDAVISCLGHNITVKGILGKPRMLVTNCIRNVCTAIQESKSNKVKVILMSTTANRYTKINEKYSLKDRIVLLLISFLLPPHKDNIKAAAYLSNIIGDDNSCIEWIAVRPDTLINEENVTECEIMESPKRSPVFDSGKTSRINVAHFISNILLDDHLWNKWKYKMPVLYNIEM